VHPRLQSGACARPLNFTVRALVRLLRLWLIVLLPMVVWATFVSLYIQSRPLGVRYLGIALAGISLTVPAMVLVLRLLSGNHESVSDLGYFRLLRSGFLAGMLCTVVYVVVMFTLGFAGMGPGGPLDVLVVWLLFASFVSDSSAKRLQ
jgi:hypothetical protein